MVLLASFKKHYLICMISHIFIKLLLIASPLDSKAITLEKAILADP